MDSWWTSIDREVLGCLEQNGAMGPEEMARALGLSEGEVRMFLTMLAREGKVRIVRVELAGDRAAAPGLAVA